MKIINKKSIWVSFIFLTLTVCFGFTWPNVWFQEEFEQRNVSLWPETNVSTSASITIASNIVHSGLYSAKFTTPATAFAVANIARYATGTNYATHYLKCWIYFDSFTGFDNSEDIGFLRLLNAASSTTDRVYLRKSSGVYTLKTDLLGNCTTPINLGQWYHIELYSVIGTGTGSSTLYINGSVEKTSSTLTVDYAQSIKCGIIYNAYGIESTVYIDDVVFSKDRIYEPEPYVRVYAPDFRSKIGNRVLAITTGKSDGDIIKAWLAGPSGYSNNWFNSAITGRDLIKGNYSGIATGEYVFNILLTDSNSIPKFTNTITWTKLYSGDPTYTIDENNNIIKQGTNFFPVDAMCLHSNSVPTYLSSNLINSLYGQMFSVDPTNNIQRALDYLNVCSNYNLYTFIPVNGAGYTPGNGTNPFTTNVVAQYCTNTLIINNDYLIGYDWFDEAADENNYTVEEVYNWGVLTKILDPGKLVHVNHMGVTFLGAPYATGFNNNRGHSMCLPWQIADIYCADYYPYEYTSTAYLSYMPIIASNLRIWNHDLLPVMMYVAPSDVRSGEGGAPTTNQLWAMCWSSVAAGSKGIHWYPYQLGIPAENAITMQNFKLKTERLVNVICGTDPTYRATCDNTNIWFLHTTYSNTNWVIACNVDSNSQPSSFTLSGLKPNKTIYLDENSETIITQSESWFDTFNAYEVNFYRLDPICFTNQFGIQLRIKWSPYTP